LSLDPVEINLLENGDYYLKLNHDALENVKVSLSKIPKDKRGGVARALFSASALYCMAGSLKSLLSARKVPVKDIIGSVSIKMGKDEKGRPLVESMELDIDVDIPDEYRSQLDRCIGYLEEGCLITRGMKKGINVTNKIKKK
jgi:organic hydroperoxide reductase OsmC/OhrA